MRLFGGYCMMQEDQYCCKQGLYYNGLAWKQIIWNFIYGYAVSDPSPWIWRGWDCFNQ